MSEKHHHHQANLSVQKAFVIGIALNTLFVIVEFSVGIWNHSVGLISDAGHNLSDVASLLLAMLAYGLTKIAATKKYTYGFKKTTVLVSLINAVILLIAVGWIISESIEKIITPKPVHGSVIAWVAALGILINLLTAVLFLKRKDKDLNIKGAYLHMVADALVSLGVVISGVLIYYTDWYIVDPIIGLGVALVIIISTWSLLKESICLSLDGVPASINVEVITELILSEKHVIDLHHLHIWALSTTENALTAHIVLNDMKHMEEIKQKLKNRLSHAGIEHVTLEFELQGLACKNNCSDPV